MTDGLLHDERIMLRAPEPEDLDAMFLWENDTRQWDNGCAVAPYSRQQLWEYIQGYEADIFKSRQLKFIIVERATEKRVGTIDLFDFDPINKRAFLGLFIDERYRRNGYATAAVEILRGYCRDFIGMHQLACIIAVDNKECLSIFEKMNFEISGKLRSWIKVKKSYKDAFFLQSIFP